MAASPSCPLSPVRVKVSSGLSLQVNPDLTTLSLSGYLSFPDVSFLKTETMCELPLYPQGPAEWGLHD